MQIIEVKMRNSSVDQIIIQILSKEYAHLKPLEIYEEIKERLPAVNQSTVYRSLDRLVNNGKLSVSDMGTGASVYELVSDHLHHHLVCQNCGDVFTIGDEEVKIFFEEMSNHYQFDIKTNHLILFGICRNCSKE